MSLLSTAQAGIVSLLMSLGKVGVYLLRHGSNETWETLVHMRSSMGNGRHMIVTPVGEVDETDCIDFDNNVKEISHGRKSAAKREIYDKNISHGRKNAAKREIWETTGLCLQGLVDDHFISLDPLSLSNDTAKWNYVVYFNTSLKFAKPQSVIERNLVRDGVAHLGDMCIP